MRRTALILTLFFIIVLAIFIRYFVVQIGDFDVVMPLDDVYIHFQYARQFALGEPYVYNPGDAPTSGATSFIYPYILAFGYMLGFQGLNLGLWSMIVGCLALVGSMWAIYRLCCLFDAPLWLSILTPVSFALTGSFSWHAMSGMETMLMVCFTLWTLLAFIEKRLSMFVVVAVLLALTRPEGSIMAGIASGLYILHLWFDKSTHLSVRQFGLLLLPILAFGVQPAVNFLLTGSFSASGSQAKSLLGVIPQDWSAIINRVIENFVRLWVELFTGYSPSQDLWYVIILTVPMGLVGLVFLLGRRKYRVTALMLVLWLLGVSSAISTLDTAFWHFKRYQMPLFVLFIPLSVIPVIWSLKRFPKVRWSTYAFDIVIVPLFIVITFSSFLTRYEVNIDYVRQQPLAIAYWLSANTPEDSVVAVHDVGMMRYMGGRKTLDIVGLTTPNAAPYWRNGVGSVAEFLIKHQPDYIASYGWGHGYGLYMLEDTAIYGEPLAEFSVNLDPQLNVALAADKQAIYQPDWEAIVQPLLDVDDVLLDVNVADIESEREAYYRWQNTDPVSGFATLVYEFELLGCDISYSQFCNVIEGARQMTGEDSILVDLSGQSDSETVILRSRVHPIDAVALDIYVSGNLIDTQWIPKNPGHWLDIETRLDANALYSNAQIKMIPHLEAGQVYMPARHTILQDRYDLSQPPDTAIANYQDTHLQLTDYQLEQTDNELSLTLDWYTDGQTTGDYRFFVHLYDDINQPPVAQWDNYLGNATLPLGNWLEGARQDTITLNISELESGEYELMIGFYEAQTHVRLMPISDNELIIIHADNRLVLQTVEIE